RRHARPVSAGAGRGVGRRRPDRPHGPGGAGHLVRRRADHGLGRAHAVGDGDQRVADRRIPIRDELPLHPDVTALKQWLAYAALRVGLAVLGVLPEPAIRWLGRLGGRLWYLLDGKRRRMALRHMRRVGGPPSAAVAVFESYEIGRAACRAGVWLVVVWVWMEARR